MKIRTAALVLAAASLTLAGCNKDKTAATTDKPVTVAATNAKCPYTGKAVNSTVTSTYKGQTVGFCCTGCQGKFDKGTAAEKDAMLAKATAK